MSESRECVHIKTQCIHPNCKCSECPMTDLICDEFYACIDRCYEEAYADGCLSGIELGKKETIEKGKEYSRNFFKEMIGMSQNAMEKLVQKGKNMKAEEALNNLKSILNEATTDENSVCYVNDNDETTLKLAIEALEKQIPKEPQRESMCSSNAFDSWDKYYCPNCNKFLHSGARSLMSKYTMPKYCNNCGQAIKWE